MLIADFELDGLCSTNLYGQASVQQSLAVDSNSRLCCWSCSEDQIDCLYVGVANRNVRVVPWLCWSLVWFAFLFYKGCEGRLVALECMTRDVWNAHRVHFG